MYAFETEEMNLNAEMTFVFLHVFAEFGKFVC